MANPARCLELQQALALLKGASDAEVKRVGGAYGVLRPLRQLRAALPHRLDLFQVEHTPDLAPPRPPSPRCLCQRLRFTTASLPPWRRTPVPLACGASLSHEGAAELQTRAATRQEAPTTEVRMPAHHKVPALPVEVVERVLPLVPACTLLRARAVCRCVRPPCAQRPWRRCGCAVSGDPAADVSGGGAGGSGGEEVGFAPCRAGGACCGRGPAQEGGGARLVRGPSPGRRQPATAAAGESRGREHISGGGRGGVGGWHTRDSRQPSAPADPFVRQGGNATPLGFVGAVKEHAVRGGGVWGGVAAGWGCAGSGGRRWTR